MRAIGDGLVNHDGIDAITFTGSTGVGRRIAAAAAARGVPVQAEMGGKNAAVVLDDADFDLALEQVMLGAFRSTGQKCTATSRLIVTDKIADRFLAALAARAEALVVGDPTDDATQMGPVISGVGPEEHPGRDRLGRGPGRRRCLPAVRPTATGRWPRATSSPRPSWS